MSQSCRSAAARADGTGEKIARAHVPGVKAVSWLKTSLLGASLLLATATLSLAQSYDPDLGQGNTAPPGVTYGGGLRYGSGISNRLPGVWSHRAEFGRQRTRHSRRYRAR